MPISHDTLPDQLEAALRQPLPGRAAQLKMAPRGRRIGDPVGYRDAAVLLALFRSKDGWRLPLILRAEDQYAHGGQIGFPGGRQEGDEGLAACALREAEEEISLPAEQVRLLGALTPLPLPVSRHIIHPFVGLITSPATFVPDQREVQEVLELSLDELAAADAPREGGVWVARSMLRQAPHFLVQGMQVWGATAMVLGEFRELLLSVT